MARIDEFEVDGVDTTPENRFDYLIDRINAADFSDDPFRHVYISDFFTTEDFSEIVAADEINVPSVESDEALIAALHERQFKEIKFPGTTTNIPQYLNWHADRYALKDARVEGFGVTMRLHQTREGSILRDMDAFLQAPRFWRCLADKFGVDLRRVRAEGGLQKYLDGYEISPHPDVRRKALTFMVNVNPAPDSEHLDYHTRYLVLRPERAYVHRAWEENPQRERTWVMWDWCQVRKQQTKNNSFVAFSPTNDTIHAVKASYNHLVTQRTQYYGNLWYNDVVLTGPKLMWQELSDVEQWESPEAAIEALKRRGFDWRQLAALGVRFE